MHHPRHNPHPRHQTPSLSARPEGQDHLHPLPQRLPGRLLPQIITGEDWLLLRDIWAETVLVCRMNVVGDPQVECYGAGHAGGKGKEDYSPVGAWVRRGGCMSEDSKGWVWSCILSWSWFRWGRCRWTLRSSWNGWRSILSRGVVMCYVVDIAKVEGGDLQMFLLQKILQLE